MNLLSLSNNQIYNIIIFSSALMVVPFIIGIFYFKYLTPLFKVVFYYVSFSVVGITIGNILGHLDKNNLLLSQILTFAEGLIIFSLILPKLIQKKRTRLILLILFISVFLIFEFIPVFKGFQTAFIYSVLIISSTSYLIKNMKMDDNNVDTNAFRIFATGVFMNFSASFLIEFIGSNIEMFTLRQHMLMGLIHTVFYILYCLCLGYSIYSCGRREKEQLRSKFIKRS